jgi:hypothetical protein
MSANGGEADIPPQGRDFRFDPSEDIGGSRVIFIRPAQLLENAASAASTCGEV